MGWVSFSNEKTVNEIFRLSMINGNANDFNAFPHIPPKAMTRKDGIEKILKRIQTIDKQLRYQVQMGEDDLVVKIKYQFKDDYRPYVSVSINDIDPNDTVPAWDLVMSKRKTPDAAPEARSEFDWQTKAGKRNASRSPEDRKNKRNNREDINNWQIAEFIHAFLVGTTTKPKYTNLDWRVEAATTLGAPVAEGRVSVEGEEATSGNSGLVSDQHSLS